MTRPSHERAKVLRQLIAEEGRCHVMPCCFDALSARLVEMVGFPLSFMSGFAVSSTRLGLPDTGLISYGEMVDQGRLINAVTSVPIIGDGDTGYGNAVNVKRTVHGYRQAGFAGVMIEDQVAPKRCGHTRGKSVVDFGEACARIQAACDARDEGTDILIMARTDARATHGLDEAIRRARAFSEIGADILFVEAPREIEEMRRITTEVPGVHFANMVEGGDTPVLRASQLAEMGFRIAGYPLTLLSAAMKAMLGALDDLKSGQSVEAHLMDFAELRAVIGFDAYDAESQRYADVAADA